MSDKDKFIARLKSFIENEAYFDDVEGEAIEQNPAPQLRYRIGDLTIEITDNDHTPIA